MTAYDRYTIQGGAVTTVNSIRSFIPVVASQSATPGTSSSSGGPASSSNTPVPIPAPTPVSSSSSSLSGGAIAGIAIGGVIAIAIIVGLILLLILQRRRRGNHPQVPLNQNSTGMIQTDPNPPPTNPPPPASPPLNNGRTSLMSNPSATSTTPLTQNNIAAVSQTPSDIRPQDSASNIGGYTGSAVSQTAPPTYHSSAGSPEHSGLGPLPGPQYPTGAAAFPHQNPPSVLSPGSAFGSMPPGVHAPSV